MKDIYDLNGRLERIMKTIQNSKKISDVNKALIIKFYNDSLAKGLSVARVLFYMNRLWNIARWINKDFRDMADEDIKELVLRINQMNYTEQTKLDHKKVIKKFFSWLDGDDKRVKWIKTWANSKNAKLPEDLLSKDDIQAMVKACYNVRDKAIISVLWESGCRIGELLSMKIRNVQFDNKGAVIMVHGKTGYRRIRLVSSVPNLSNWLEHHPCKNDPEAPLWVSLGSKNHAKQVMYHCINTMLRKVAKRAGIKKKVNPHMFRHSRATDLANLLTEAQMKTYFGWTNDSKMASVYVHLSGRDVDEAILRIHGKLNKNEELKHEQLRTQICPICNYENAPEADFCLRCRRPLNLRASLEMEEKEQKLLKLITPEMIEQMIQKKVEEILAKYMPKSEPQMIKVMV
jgi:integrase/ribosomal protein L40E